MKLKFSNISSAKQMKMGSEKKNLIKKVLNI